ncbi:MAG: hypothetical protein WBP94_00985 [Rhodomicrobiaceae bacterium]
MATNLEKLKGELDRLIREGVDLDVVMKREIDKNTVDKLLQEQLGKKKAEEFIKKLPDFNAEYEGWYSESYALIRQLIPDRASHFLSLYEKPKSRKSVEYGNYVMQDNLQGLCVMRGMDVKVDRSAALPQFQQQLSILKAARRRFQSSLFEIRQILQTDLFDSEIEAARELSKKNFLRAAGTIAGVVLEKHLLQVCHDHKLKITKKYPGLADLSEILKSNSVIDIPQWRHISLLADIRNLCAHNKQKEPTFEQVDDLIEGAAKILKTIV